MGWGGPLAAADRPHGLVADPEIGREGTEALGAREPSDGGFLAGGELTPPAGVSQTRTAATAARQGTKVGQQDTNPRADDDRR